MYRALIHCLKILRLKFRIQRLIEKLRKTCSDLYPGTESCIIWMFLDRSIRSPSAGQAKHSSKILIIRGRI